MKVAILGATLNAGVMAVLLSEYGNHVYWCSQQSNEHSPQKRVQYLDEDVNARLNRQHKLGQLFYCSVLELPLDVDVYLFCYSPTEIELAIQTLKILALKPIIHPRLMINAATFGLNGTNKLSEISPQDYWVYLPDVIQEGNAINSMLHLKQVIVGVEQEPARTMVEELLRPVFNKTQQYLFMPILDAEFTKLSISGMLATRISYINDMALVAEKLGIDIANVAQGMGADSRIGSAYLSPGVGFGGENFSHDILTLSSEVSKSGAKSHLLQQVWDINEQQKEILFRKLWSYYHSDLRNKVVAIWGASFKENTSSIHNSPIHAMLNALWAQGVRVKLHDPQAMPEIYQQYGHREDLILCTDAYEAVQDADALCVITAWKQYFSPDYKKLQQLMHHPLILDGRNIYDPLYVKAQGFAYGGVGRV
ncbi:nucleotide sugar dehydrogenase [Acinetobacter sp. NigerLNRRAM0016]